MYIPLRTVEFLKILCEVLNKYFDIFDYSGSIMIPSNTSLLGGKSDETRAILSFKFVNLTRLVAHILWNQHQWLTERSLNLELCRVQNFKNYYWNSRIISQTFLTSLLIFREYYFLFAKVWAVSLASLKGRSHPNCLSKEMIFLFFMIPCLLFKCPFMLIKISGFLKITSGFRRHIFIFFQ